MVLDMARPPGQTLSGPTGLPSTVLLHTSDPAASHRFLSALLSSSRCVSLTYRSANNIVGNSGKAEVR